jgi:hypothetical protein
MSFHDRYGVAPQNIDDTPNKEPTLIGPYIAMCEEEDA